MEREKHKSCGGIIFKESNESKEIRFLVIQHVQKGGNHWDFPKGHVEGNETESETAIREIREETGLEVEFVKGFREVINYINHINNVDKEVIYFLCESKSENVKIQIEEIQNYAWLEYDKAMKKLTHENAKNILTNAKEHLLKK